MKKHFLLASAIFLFTFFNPFGTTEALGQYTQLTDFTGTTTLPENKQRYDEKVISVGGFYYGITYEGGKDNTGTIFKVNPSIQKGFVKIYDFTDTLNGKNPVGSLISNGTFLYGMTRKGGTNDMGTLFKIKIDGTGFVKLLDFTGTANGKFPNGSLISDGTFLYGMTLEGGASDMGTIFKIKLDGTGFIKLFDFAGAASGAWPSGSLISDGTFLYGMAGGFGTSNMGTIFKIKLDGTGFVKLFDFLGAVNGMSPRGSLISNGTFLYGMTHEGGANNFGTVFKIMPDGTGFTKLLDFDGTLNGKHPNGSLLTEGTFLYGMTREGGAGNMGTIFKIKPDGTGYAKMLDFNGAVNGKFPNGSLIFDPSFSILFGMTSGGGLTDFGTIFSILPDGTSYYRRFDFHNSPNGKGPVGSLISIGTFLYGMTELGGPYNAGTIFRIKPDGTGFTQLFEFDRLTTGETPTGSLISDGIFLYGMTYEGGSYSNGIIFKIKPDGSGYTLLHEFDKLSNGAAPNGRRPIGSLFSDGTFLYGLTREGGVSTGNLGTIFKIKPDGTGFNKLFDFTVETNGKYPLGSLISDGKFLYGITREGGTNGVGTIFKIMPDGTGFVKLLDFEKKTNGQTPVVSLIYDGTFLYGMTQNGGESYCGNYGCGTIFKIKPDGTGFVKLHDKYIVYPSSSLISDGTFLYGISREGGSYNSGTLFKLKPDGTGFVKFLDFYGKTAGSSTFASIISDGIFLYGTTYSGDFADRGTIFKYQIGTSTDIPKVSAITSQLTVYPNPNCGSFTIHSETEGVYAILNELGQTIKIVKLNAENKNSVMVDNLSKGIYFITGTQNGIFSRQKIVVMN